MSEPSYRVEGLTLGRGLGRANDRQVRDFQRDLRSLGYLGHGIDGDFGTRTERAVRALRHDLSSNRGGSLSGDGRAPVRVVDYNRGRVQSESEGTVDQGLVACMAEMLADPAWPKLPFAEDPIAENRQVRERLRALSGLGIPAPFLLAIFRQESDGRHFREPEAGDEDNYITVGLDRNAGADHVITSRGFGVGQYTLFHHPPQLEEVDSFMRDVEGNIRQAIRELRSKFDHFVNGPTGGTRADDRLDEIGNGPLRACRFEASDPRYLRDCRRCAEEAGAVDIREGVTRLRPNSPDVFTPTMYYARASYDQVPRRDRMGCDWPYALRRYNGAGVNSYHYQARVLGFLRDLPED